MESKEQNYIHRRHDCVHKNLGDLPEETSELKNEFNKLAKPSYQKKIVFLYTSNKQLQVKMWKQDH